MFSRFETVLKLTALCLILGLCGWTWYQSQKISSLKAENQAQAQTIKSQEQVNQSLKDTIETERQAVEQQRVINDEIKQTTQDKVQIVRKIIKSQPCYNTRIYDDAIERLH
jgi:hypothetical protein|uniref:DUF2570 domain-containing protein n=1 Tax=Phage sp. ct17O1 TaxID=2825789 RepID=A0A8S5PL60_9VIRU|nr:MAG TPA: Protein of unknown function (DUF2570) [Phage sp. ct17O1]